MYIKDVGFYNNSIQSRSKKFGHITYNIKIYTSKKDMDQDIYVGIIHFTVFHDKYAN